jgi:Zn-dependent M16 (insulinase) family peptidase
MLARRFALALLLMTAAATLFAAAPPTVELKSLADGQAIAGFKVTAVYLNDADQPMGARFVHRKSGFTLDILRIESIPQAHTWVNSFPVSDQGEPHTQEHLLVGKGKTGRALNGLDTMWLATSNAFTQQWRTCYTLNTSAGSDVFFSLFDATLNALLNPDYSEEEVRREVRNFGITENPDKSLRLEEKGSVYNEMTSSSNNPFRQLFRAGGLLTYGSHHPLSYNAGGEPSGIRTMKPVDIRNFHDANYYLGNMGSIVALPPTVPLGETLTRMDAILTRLQGTAPTRKAKTMEEQPKPEMAPAGSIAFGEYPNRNAQQPSPVAVIWPPVRTLTADDELLLNFFFDNVASDATSNLYKTFVDSKTRTLDVGAKGVGNNVSSDQGHPVYVFLTDVTGPNLTKEKLAEVRKAVVDEIARVAAFKDDSPELADFNKRVEGRVTETQRDLSKFVNSPPGFGFRNTGSGWMSQLVGLEKVPGFKKSLTLKPELARVRELLASKKNFWRDRLAKWSITGAEPYVVAAKPAPELIARNESERVARIQAETERLEKQYGVADGQEAIKRYRADYDAGTATIDAEAKAVKPAAFVDQPPMTIDDQLQFRLRSFGGQIPMVASTFENMTSATTGLALRLDTVPAEDLQLLPLFPALLTRVGVIDDGKPVSFDEMTERQRKEILSLNAVYSINPRTGRAELVVRGAGNDVAESKRAIEWIRLVLEHPDWRVENLARIRDLVDQLLSQNRNTMQGAEESWVQNPSEAWRRQDNALLMATASFLTRTHAALRLRWMLKEAPAANREALATWFTTLAGAAKDVPRADLKAKLTAGIGGKGSLVEGLSDTAKPVAIEALRDLDLTLIEIPDASLAADFAQVATDMRADLLTPPADVLARLDGMRKRILHTMNARLFLVGASETQKALEPLISSLVGALDTTPLARVSSSEAKLVENRLRQRGAITEAPTFVGLLAPNMNGGVIITGVPIPRYADAGDKEGQLDYLATRLFAGGGAHGIFLKTIGAGLAYSNGLRGSISGGRAGYYAERTPELPQTVKFVIGELKAGARDTYEARAEAMAADLADGQTPDQVRAFRQSILELRKDPKLGDKLFDRKDRALAPSLPGWSQDWKPADGGTYFTIGPDKQLDAWEAYVKGFGYALVRVYPRDFWM